MFLFLFNLLEKDWVIFYKEIVRIECHKDYVHVTGEYYFKNTRKTIIAAQLIYPFPMNKVYEYPHFIETKNHSYWKIDNGIKLNLNFKPLEKKIFQVDYKQNILSRKAEYILSTSLNWNGSIQEATFYVVIPKNFRNVKLSYDYQEKIIKNETIIYKIARKNLRTDKNIIVTWE